MINQFDFFYVQATSHSIRALKSAGVNRTDIRTQVQWGGRFPTNHHTATLQYFNVMNVGHESARSEASEFIATLPKVAGVKYYLRFQPVD
jgi:hypothetical protein